MARILTSHEEIRQWATARGGNPMMLDTPDVHEDRVLLQITFGQHALNAERNEGPDNPLTGGWTLSGWDEWLEQLEKNGLALKVNDDQPGVLDNDFHFVPREGNSEEQTTNAARQPANISIKTPGKDDRSAPDPT
ncbi:hypothetical protein [Devosia naphthalenivorans]|uniref:hypothetical protein n=1 Tax=Devosia naphthalenivorans TaxID=2082392 RepID=UPI0013B0525E|nr:hypothetical protein [Devosia naphthalenivorans]